MGAFPVRDPFATQHNSPSPSPVSRPRPRNNATVPDYRPGAPEGVSDASPWCAAHAPGRGGARLVRDSTSPPSCSSPPLPTSTSRLRAAHRPECTAPGTEPAMSGAPPPSGDGTTHVRLGRLGRFTERGGRAEFRWDPQTAKQPEPRHLPDGTTHVRLGRLGRFTKKGGVCGISMGSAQVSIYLVF